MRGLGLNIVRGPVVACWALAALLATVCPVDAEENYPSQPIRIIMPLGPGGIGDVYLRALTQRLQERLGQSVIVDNRPGAAATLGTRACTQSQPDGYALCMVSIDAISIAPFVFDQLAYEPARDLEPIMRLFFINQGLMVHPSLGVDTVAGLVALSKAKPGTLSYATQATQITMVMEEFNRATGSDLQRVPFSAGGQAISSVFAGTVPVGFLGIGNLIGQVREGKIKLLAVDGAKRSPLYPSAPTLTEAGFTGEILPAWYGLFAPAKTPKAVVTRIYNAVIEIHQDPIFVERNLMSRGLEPAFQDPDTFRDFLKGDRVRAGRMAAALKK
jgi:tripartite-type tricarboxylate transporter receptor subunit TctC